MLVNNIRPHFNMLAENELTQLVWQKQSVWSKRAALRPALKAYTLLSLRYLPLDRCMSLDFLCRNWFSYH